ncbi:MAG: hypothetical protein OHK0039_10670 [Bacteroidia bacterium]
MRTLPIALLMLLGLLLAACTSKSPQDTQAPVETLVDQDDPDNPLMPSLESICYLSPNREAMRQFFTQTLQARAVSSEGEAFDFMDALEVRPGQPLVRIFDPGPYADMQPGTAYTREALIAPTHDNHATYGVYWAAFITNSIDGVVADLEASGVKFDWYIRNLPLPHEPGTRAASLWTPDRTLIVLVERATHPGQTLFSFDHLMIMVENLETAVDFYRKAWHARVASTNGRLAVMEVGGLPLVLAEPQVLGMKPSLVLRARRSAFRPGVAAIGLRFDQLDVQIESLQAAGIAWLQPPVQPVYRGSELPYRLGLLASPDSMKYLVRGDDPLPQ